MKKESNSRLLSGKTSEDGFKKEVHQAQKVMWIGLSLVGIIMLLVATAVILLMSMESNPFKNSSTEKTADTKGAYQKIGEIYGFPVSVISSYPEENGKVKRQNRFVVEGEEWKYRHNNGQLAMSDTKAASSSFLKALEHIPEIIKQYEKKNKDLDKDIILLKESAGRVWNKEEELQKLKSDLAAIERKISSQLSASSEITKAVQGMVKNEDIYLFRHTKDDKWYIQVALPEGKTNAVAVDYSDIRKVETKETSKMDLAIKYLADDVINKKVTEKDSPLMKKTMTV